jgi:hypothetical protein
MSDEREHEDNERTVDRRRLLRRAGTVAAGVAGAGVVTAVAAAPAQATDGSALIQGQTNTGGAPTTTVANSSANATVALSNSGAGPQLQLTPSATFDASIAPAGSLAADSFGELWSGVDLGSGPFPVLVYTTLTANITETLGTPQRVLDTRTAAGRANLISPGSNIDGSGRIIGGRTVNLNLSGLVNIGLTVMGNLTVVSPAATSYVTVFANGTPRPATSNINFNANQILSNFTISAIGGDPNSATQHDVISIYCNTTTHVIFDVMAFVVQDSSQVLGGLSAQASRAGALSAQAERQQAALKRLQQGAAK